MDSCLKKSTKRRVITHYKRTEGNTSIRTFSLWFEFGREQNMSPFSRAGYAADCEEQTGAFFLLVFHTERQEREASSIPALAPGKNRSYAVLSSDNT